MKQLRQLFEGLTSIITDLKVFIDNIYQDIFPETTREIDFWEKQFGLPNTLTNDQERRDRLDATWKAQGGQSPRYLQDTLQAAGFDVYIHEWWEVPRTEPPVARNPLLYLNDGTGVTKYVMGDGTLEANDGAVEANDGASLDPTGFALVNKILTLFTGFIGDGAAAMNDGAQGAVDGGATRIYKEKQFVVPSDPTKWPYFLYIGGQNFPDHAIIDASRKNEFETLCLKLCPTQQWLGMLITYA
jgi:hypothetical protein